MMMHHRREPYSSNTCMNQFAWSSNLQQYNLSHSGRKSFSCKRRLQQLKQFCRLNLHMLLLSERNQIILLFVLRKDILKMHIAIYWGKMSDFWSKPWSTAYVRIVKTRGRLHGYAVAPEPSLFAYIIRIITTCTCLFYLDIHIVI